jgi:hypothetical protein
MRGPEGEAMGFLRDWLEKQTRGGDREMQELMNPLLRYHLQHFVAFTADPSYLRHWFSFKNKKGETEEFITNYRVIDGHTRYIRTHWKKPGEDFFVTLSERDPWSTPITFLIELGKTLPVNTMNPDTHPARNVSPGPLGHPDWKPPVTEPPASPHQWKRDQPSPPPRPPAPDLDGFTVGEAIHFKPFNAMARIVDLEKFEGIDGDTHRFVIEFDEEEAELRVPVAKLRDLLARKPRVYTKEELAEFDDDEEEGPILESHGFKVGEHVVYTRRRRPAGQTFDSRRARPVIQCAAEKRHGRNIDRMD